MINPFTRTRFHADLRLETWYPEGVLDGPMAAFMANCISFEERMVGVPFNRFTDMSGLTAIHLDFMEIADLATQRREAYGHGPAVKSAFFAPQRPAYGVARMFAALMEESPIDAQVFRRVEDAAQWLGVPVETIRVVS